MRILFSLFIATATMLACGSAAEAQYIDGYQFGTGVGFGRGYLGACCTTPREQPPYFAQYPPVYYNGIVKRPYGISPFAAPPGIAPVELSIPVPLTVRNPYFENNVAPVSDTNAEETIETADQKVTWQANPYVETLVLSGYSE